jgi:hypothetical protein
VGGVNIEFVTSTGAVNAVTNAQGVYSVELNIPEMELVAVNIHHPGYLPFNDTQATTPGEDHEIDFSLIPV